MPLIFKSKNDRLAFQVGRASSLRSTSELVDQLQEQLRKEREQHRFNLSQREHELALALKELAELRLQLARRDRNEAFERAPSPSTMMH